MDAVVALLVALAVFVPCMLFGLGKRRPAAPAETGERRAAPNVTVVQKVTAVAVASIRQVIGAAERPALTGPTTPDVETDEKPPPPPGRTPVDDWADPDLSNLDDLLNTPHPGADVPEPPIWADTEVIRPPRQPLPAVEGVERDALPPASPHQRETAQRSHDEDTPGALPPVDTTVTGGQLLEVEQAPVILEGVDMSHAPIERTSDGAVRLPSISQMQQALATGGFERLLGWLKAFKKASNNTLEQAKDLHGDAMAIARRTRTKYALAMQAFEAVQADRLDRQTINRMVAILEQAHREAVAAAATTRTTAALVVAAGGSQPTVAAAITTLNRNHGAISAAVKASPQPVPNIGFYKQ
jgi:hypothetical protein